MKVKLTRQGDEEAPFKQVKFEIQEGDAEELLEAFWQFSYPFTYNRHTIQELAVGIINSKVEIGIMDREEVEQLVKTFCPSIRQAIKETREKL